MNVPRETPQVQRPEVPGWYWLIGIGEPRCVQVFDNDGHGLRVMDYDGESAGLMDPSLLLARWYGPLPTPESTAGPWDVYPAASMESYARGNMARAVAEIAAELKQVREAYDNRTRDWYAQGDAYDAIKAFSAALQDKLVEVQTRLLTELSRNERLEAKVAELEDQLIEATERPPSWSAP